VRRIFAQLRDFCSGCGFLAVRNQDAFETHCKRDAVAKKTYICAPQYPQAAFDKALVESKADVSWRTFINDPTGPDVMIDRPEWLADVLLKVS
jgi:hypothetical protein